MYYDGQNTDDNANITDMDGSRINLLPENDHYYAATNILSQQHEQQTRNPMIGFVAGSHQFNSQAQSHNLSQDEE